MSKNSPVRAPRAIAAPGMTKWTNPEGMPTVKLSLYKHPPVMITRENAPPIMKDPGTLDIDIAPGDSVLLPSEFDNAIQRCDENGVVQSGKCPWLLKNDVEPEVHESLDPVAQQRIAAEAKEKQALQEKAEAEQKLLAAQQSKEAADRQEAKTASQAQADAAKSDAGKSGGQGGGPQQQEGKQPGGKQ